jgi:DNA repair exonuclease SbcCD ATPase subunit
MNYSELYVKVAEDAAAEYAALRVELEAAKKRIAELEYNRAYLRWWKPLRSSATKPQCDEQSVVPGAVEALMRRVAELEAVVNQLPKTADGVPCIPGETPLWHRSHIDRQGHVDDKGNAAFYYGCGEYRYEAVGDCYSTREAAQAAKAKP